MPACSVVICKKSSRNVNYKDNGISFHTYPKDPEIKKKWIDATGRGPNWFPTEHSRICSVHFEPKCFQPLEKIHRLFECAVPTLKLRAVFVDNPPNNVDSKYNEEDQTLAASSNNMQVSPRQRRLWQTVLKQKHLLKNLKLKIIRLQKNTSRYRKKVGNLTESLKYLKDKKYIEDDQVTQFENIGVSDLTKRRETNISSGQTTRQQYSSALRDFNGDGAGSSSQPQHIDQKHVCSQIKHSLQQLRRKSNPEPEKPTLELEVYSEPKKIDIEVKDSPDIDIDETSLYVDESQPLEEDETKIEDDKIQATKKKTTKPTQISKLQPRKLKRNPRRKVVLKRLQKEAIEAARSAPGIEQVYLDKPDPELPTDDLPLTLQQKEELYEFGKFIAEQLMTFNQKDVKEAHNEIMEVIKKYRLKYKILNCVTKTSATKPTTTKTNLSNGRPMSKTESQQPSTAAKIKSLLHSASLQQHETVSKPPSLVKPHTAPADIIQPIKQAENPMSNTQTLNPFTALKSLLLAPLKKLESVSKPRTLVKPPAAPANTIQPIRQAEKIPGKTLKTYERKVKTGQKEAGGSTSRLAVNTTLSTLTLGSGGADEIPLSLVLVPSKDGSLQLTTARVDAAGTIMTFPNAPRVNIEPIPANMSHPGVSGAQSNLKLLQLAQDVGSTVVQMPQTSATVQQPIKQVPTNTGAVSQQGSQSNVTEANPERLIDAPNISHDIALDPLKVEPMETMDEESEIEEPVSVSEALVSESHTDTEKVVFKCEVPSDEDSDSD